MSDAVTSSPANAENFNLKDLFSPRTTPRTLADQVRPFIDFYRPQEARGVLLYARTITSAMDRVVRVREGDGEREMVMFGSNNYLGFANDPYIKDRVKAAVDQYGIGVGGPPLLNGMSALHRELERALADLKGAEDALIFGSGFQANVGWLGALMRPDDVLLYDELNHASLFDGIKLAHSTGFVAKRFAHNDMVALEALLVEHAGRRTFVAVEGVYSMDGDLAPLDVVSDLCKRHGAILFVDDAHGTGVMGATGAGASEHFGLGASDVALSFGTFSKVFATTGGFIAGDRDLIHYLRFFARSYMFSAHLAPPVVASVLGGLELLQREPERRARLHNNVAYVADALRGQGHVIDAPAAIIAVAVPNRDIRALARRFHERGIFLNSIEYPAVPLSAQRLRVSVMSEHTQADLDALISAFRDLLV